MWIAARKFTEITIQVRIPAPVRIWVGVVAQALAVARTGIFESAAPESFPERAGVRVHTGAVAGNREAAGRFVKAFSDKKYKNFIKY